MTDATTIPSMSQKRDPFIAGIVLVLWVLLGIFVLYPLARLFGRAFFDDGAFVLQPFLDVVGNANHRKAFLNSLLLALAVGVGGTALGFLFAFTAVRAGLSKRVMGFIDTATLLPLISPPFTISVAILFSFGARGLITYDLLGRALSSTAS
jgi:iron(III) transport system permease protein